MKICGICQHYITNKGLCRSTGRPVSYLDRRLCYEEPVPIDTTTIINTIMEESPTPQTKVCNSCGRELPLSAFSKHRGHKDGLQDACKECIKERYANSHRPDRYRMPKPVDTTFSDDELIYELQRRGWRGTLTKNIEKTL